jgi:hypothetical protein
MCKTIYNKKMSSVGYVYCLTNASMPGLVKIGMTMEDPSFRASELSSPTGVPTAFVVAISKRILNPAAKETAIHNLLTTLGYRFNERREFFTCSLNIVGLLFDVIDGDDVNIEDAEAIPVFKHQNVSVVKLG